MADPGGARPLTLRGIRIGRLGGFVLSLDRPESLRYLLEALYPPHGRQERWKLSWARLLPWPLAARWTLETGAASPDAEDPFAEELPLLHDLTRHPDLVAKAVPGDASLSWVARAREGRAGASDAEIVYLLPRGYRAPAAVLEIHAEESSAVCSDEAGALRWLASSLSAPLAARVPRVLFHQVRSGLEILCLSGVSGPSAYVELRQRGGSLSLAIRHLTAAADWLVPFHRETRSGARWQLPPFAELAPSLDPAEAPQWWADLRTRLERRPLPRVGRHGDFWSRNLFPGNGDSGSSVVDWEAFRTNASPLDDLFDFALSYGETLSGSSSRGSVDAFLRAFGGGRYPGPQVWTCVRQVLAGLGLEPGIDRSLLGVYLLDRARHAGLGPAGRLGRARPASFWLECFRRWQP